KAALAEFVEHDIRDVVGSVEADEIEERQWSHGMSATELHGIVDVFDGAHALLERANGVEEIGHEKAIDDESGAVVGSHRSFAELGADTHHFFIHRRIGGDRSYNFDELHDWHGIEKMQSDKTLRP